MTEAEDRYEREQGFHDQAFETHSRDSTGRFYAILAPAEAAFWQAVRDAGTGARILEYGCGQGGRLFQLVPYAASLAAIDLSPIGVQQARKEAEERGINADIRVMNAEALEFDDGSFDLIVVNGILHTSTSSAPSARSAVCWCRAGAPCSWSPSVTIPWSTCTDA